MVTRKYFKIQNDHRTLIIWGMENGGLCFCKLVHEIHGRVITLPRTYLLSLPGFRPDSWPFQCSWPFHRSAVIFSIVKKGWKDQEMVLLVLWYYSTRKHDFSRMLLWMGQQNPASPTGWLKQLVTGWSGEDRISQLLSEALAAKDTEDLEFEVVDWLDLWSIIGSIPSGKRLQNYGKSPFLVGKSTINGNFHLVI